MTNSEKLVEEIVAQLWCLPQHCHKVMDVEFANSIIRVLSTERQAREKAEKISDKWSLKCEDLRERLQQAISTIEEMKGCHSQEVLIIADKLKQAEAIISAGDDIKRFDYGAMSVNDLLKKLENNGAEIESLRFIGNARYDKLKQAEALIGRMEEAITDIEYHIKNSEGPDTLAVVLVYAQNALSEVKKWKEENLK